MALNSLAISIKKKLASYIKQSSLKPGRLFVRTKICLHLHTSAKQYKNRHPHNQNNNQVAIKTVST